MPSIPVKQSVIYGLHNLGTGCSTFFFSIKLKITEESEIK